MKAFQKTLRKIASTKTIVIPLIAAVVTFSFARPTMAQFLDEDAGLSQYLADSDIEVGNESVENRSRVYFMHDDTKVYISDPNANSRQPHTRGQYITYVSDVRGVNQIFLYHISTDKTVQLTHSGTNLSPKVNANGAVVWEGWVEKTDQQNEGWQLFIYDGESSYQLTHGQTSKNADIENDYVVFGRKEASGYWRAEAYSLIEKKFQDISAGEESEHPELESDGTVYYGPPTEQQKKHPLKVQDLFVLDLAPLHADEGTGGEEAQKTIEDILAQLEEVEQVIKPEIKEPEISTQSAELE
ncbi:TolB family protein [Patescibacteria group bacterium]